MNYKKLLFQTIPTVGAIGLAACAPDRNDRGGDGGGSGLVGVWELGTYGSPSGYYSEYPQVYTYDGCTMRQGFFLEVAADLNAAITIGTEFEGCEYTSSYGYRYPGTWEEIDGALARLSFNGSLTPMDCPTSPGSEMQCVRSTDYYNYTGYYDGRRGYYKDFVYNFTRSTAASIPEVDVDVDVPVPGDEPTEDVGVPPN